MLEWELLGRKNIFPEIDIILFFLWLFTDIFFSWLLNVFGIVDHIIKLPVQSDRSSDGVCERERSWWKMTATFFLLKIVWMLVIAKQYLSSLHTTWIFFFHWNKSMPLLIQQLALHNGIKKKGLCLFLVIFIFILCVVSGYIFGVSDTSDSNDLLT